MEGKAIDYLINEQIRDKEVRVIGAEGNQLGVMSIKEARDAAEEAGLDLVRVSPNAKPPVCKIIDYGKYRYELARKEKEAKKKQKVVDIKEVRLSPNIDTNDLNTKVNQARKFLQKGNRVKVTLRFRGRELAYVNQSKPILDDFAEKLSDVSTIDKPAKFEGRSMIMFLAANPNKLNYSTDARICHIKEYIRQIKLIGGKNNAKVKDKKSSCKAF